VQPAAGLQAGGKNLNLSVAPLKRQSGSTCCRAPASYMEHKKVNAKLPLSTALLLLEQLTLVTRVYAVRIRIGSIEVGCTNCRSVKAIKKALSDCCAELFDNVVQIEVEIKYNYNVEQTLQAFRRQKFGYIVAVQ
jgi:hypothetical protein